MNVRQALPCTNIINISWLPLSQHIYQTCARAQLLSLGSSMVSASHRSSHSCGFDPPLRLRNRFSEVRLELDERSSIILVKI